MFISYRRDVGGILAMALYQQLSEHGFDAFYDIESLRAGQFETIIMNQIVARPYFVLVLTPGTLERCVDANDLLRREIEKALGTGRVMVPAYTPNFEFADFQRFLPGEVGQQVVGFNGQELSQKWFKSAVQQLVEEFLVPIQLESVEPPLADEAVVQGIREHAKAAPVVTSVQLSAQEYFEHALARAADDLDGKIVDYSEAIRLNPEYGYAFKNRGFARASKGDLDGAIADFDESIRLVPENATPFINRGNALFKRGDALYKRGVVGAAQGDLEGAIADYSQAMRLAPDRADLPTLLRKLREQKENT